jgi:hypothetical protein
MAEDFGAAIEAYKYRYTATVVENLYVGATVRNYY